METKDIIVIIFTVIFTIACIYGLWAVRNDSDGEKK